MLFIILQLIALGRLIIGIGAVVTGDYFDADSKTRKFDFWYQ
jgi:hypothetical protein